MSQATVVISGAGIAGPALAFWLNEYGYRTVIVELAPGIRPGGQTVDLRGAGADVVQRMGLLAEMDKHSLFQRGIAWVRSDGSRRAEMPVDAFGGNGPVSKLEILRGDLVDVLYQSTRADTDYRFNNRISELTEQSDGVDVTLADGAVLHADLVVGADGPHSAVRRMVFGPEEQFVKPIGGYNAWFTAPDCVGLDSWYLMYQAAGGLNASLRPTHDPASAKAGLAFRSDPIDYDRRDVNAQRQLLVNRFAGAGWCCDALLAAAQVADDFYFDAFCQVHMDAWTKGRVALVGDAGYCASPLSGMGTSLALVGSYILAGELGPAQESLDSDRIAGTFARYTDQMRPFVTACQDLPNSVERFAPMTESEIASNAMAMKYMQYWPLRVIAKRLWFTIAQSVDVPDYRPALA